METTDSTTTDPAQLVERGPKHIAITDVPEAAALVSTMYRAGGRSPYETMILGGQHDGTGWEQSTEFAAMLLHHLLVDALRTGGELPQGGERE